MGTGLFIAIIAGWVIDRLKIEGRIEDQVTQINVTAIRMEEGRLNDRFRYGWDAVKDIMGKGSWWSVPLSVAIGIPMYSNAAGIIPVVEALLGKGAALGTVLAFMMSVIALSLPEMVILRKVLKPRLIAVFIGVVGSGILEVSG
jgi:hypothetical protein